MSKNNTECSLIGFSVHLIGEFDEYRNDAYRVIILRNVETLDGMYVQKYLVIHKIDDYRLCELQRGDKIRFIACVVDQFGNKIFDPHDFQIMNKDKDA